MLFERIEKRDVVQKSPPFDDEAVLARFGKKQQLRRGFKTLSAVGLTCALMLTWEVIAMTLQYGLQNGGPAGLIYGFFFAWIGAILQALVMAEMASMIPLAGGPFNWVAVLSPSKYKNFLSYLAGWLTLIAWQSIVANTAYICGTLIQGLLVLNYPDYVFERYHGTLLFFAVILTAVFVNTYLGRLLPQIEGLMLILFILAFFGVMIPLVYLTPSHKSAYEVFTQFENMGGWSSTALAVFVGLITNTGSLLGIDGADHIAEEIQNAPATIPKSMMISIVLNGALGLGILLALVFSMGDITETINSPTGFPFIEIFTYASGSNAGGTAMTIVIIVVNIFSLTAILATASRMLWAFAREDGLPASRWIAKIHERLRLPVNAIVVSTVINMLLALINIGSRAAFQAFISLNVAAYYSSFMLAASVMLRLRLTNTDLDIPWGPFRLGRWGVPITIVAMAYTIICLFFSFWPVSPQVTPTTMNYSVLIFGGALIFSLGFWVVYGRHVYTGPIVEMHSAMELRGRQDFEENHSHEASALAQAILTATDTVRLTKATESNNTFKKAANPNLSFEPFVTKQFNHGIGEIVQALLDSGMSIVGLEEHLTVPWHHGSVEMKHVGGNEWTLKQQPDRLPHSYTLQAVKRSIVSADVHS